MMRGFSFRSRWLFVIGIVLACFPAHGAQLPACLGFKHGTFAIPYLETGQILGEGPVSLQRDGEAMCLPKTVCPSVPVHRPYVVPRNLVIITALIPGYACVTFPTPHGDYFGWVPANRVDILTNGLPTPPGAWAGKWRGTWSKTNQQELDITVDGDDITVHGHAFNAEGPDPENTGSISTSEVDGDNTAQGNNLSITEGEDQSDCKLRLVLLNKELFVEDTDGCGPSQSTLSGDYHREKLVSSMSFADH